MVVLCAEKPTVSLLKRVAAELPVQLKQISEEHQYTVAMEPEDSAVLVADDTITVKVFLTSPLLREPQQGKLLNPLSPRLIDLMLKSATIQLTDSIKIKLENRTRKKCTRFRVTSFNGIFTIQSSL